MKLTELKHIMVYRCVHCDYYTVTKYDGLSCKHCGYPLFPIGQAILYKKGICKQENPAKKVNTTRLPLGWWKN